ncbi:hypothetical protein M885DRAFT_537192 [Pelagophyceae sp. CCMP2097]|nr:hypothetical protein M885DRAFT_537192 [Pelagophyceae sp. CCMP2097]
MTAARVYHDGAVKEIPEAHSVASAVGVAAVRRQDRPDWGGRVSSSRAQQRTVRVRHGELHRDHRPRLEKLQSAHEEYLEEQSKRAPKGGKQPWAPQKPKGKYALGEPLQGSEGPLRARPVVLGAAGHKVSRAFAAKLDALFDHFDTDHSGEIDATEMIRVLVHFTPQREKLFVKPNGADVEFVMSKADKDGDVGTISRDELHDAILVWRALELKTRPAPERRNFHGDGCEKSIGRCIISSCVVA